MKEQSKKITIATTLIMLAALLFVAVFGVLTKGFADNSLFANNANTNQIEQPNVVDGDGKIYDMPANMSFSAEALAESGTVSVNISATVTPADAANKLVDWSVAWADGSTDLIVTDYVTVTAQADGSNVATITCKKAFAKDISVTVTTRQGAFKATCRIIFEGKPTSISCTNLNSEIENLATSSDFYKLPANGKEYVFDLGLEGKFGVVGSKYQNYTSKITASGKHIQASKSVADSDSSMIYYSNETRMSTVFVLALWINSGHSMDELVSCRIVDNKLYIKVNKVLEGGVFTGNTAKPGEMERLNANGKPVVGEYVPCMTTDGVFKEWGNEVVAPGQSEKNCLYVTVSVPNTDISISVPFRPVVATNGVSLSNSNLQF
ncbi:MAG: hypothetical protein RR405_02490 [Clostridia bacterium]